LFTRTVWSGASSGFGSGAEVGDGVLEAFGVLVEGAAGDENVGACGCGPGDRGWPDATVDLQVNGYAGVDVARAEADDLARLNEALEPIWVIADLSFTCSSGADELVIGGPGKGDAPDRVIMATWYNGRMRLNVY